MRRNIERLRALEFRPRRLAGFSVADTGAVLLGRTLAAPVYVCPMGAQDIVHTDGELASARGAAKAGVAYMLSSASNRPLEEVARVAPDLLRMFVRYPNEDPAVNRSLAQRARAAGYAAIVMTVDSLEPGNSDCYRAMGSSKSHSAGYGDFDPRRGGRGNFAKLKKDFTPADIATLKEASGLPGLSREYSAPTMPNAAWPAVPLGSWSLTMVVALSMPPRLRSMCWDQS